MRSKPAAKPARQLFVMLVVAAACCPGVDVSLAGGIAAGKTCRSETETGKVTTWHCTPDQKCCSAEALGIYACGNKLLGCFLAHQADPSAIKTYEAGQEGNRAKPSARSP